MTAVKTMAVAVVLLALAVHSEEVSMLDDGASAGQVVQGAEGGPAAHAKEEGKKKVRFNRKAFFHGDVDSDEASLDNGDDTNLLQLWAGMQARHQTPPSEAGSHSEIGDLGEAVDVTQAPAEADNSAADETEPDASTSTENPASTDTNSSFPALPHVTPMDEKYMPAIMDKLIKMRDEMMTLKGANWEEILETHRDGVVQIMVVKKKFLWKAAYRSPMSEEISGSGWFINNNEFSVHTQQDLLVVTNAHVAKNAAEINILIPSLGQEPIPAEVVGLCSQRDIAILRVVDKPKLLELYQSKTGKVDIVRMTLGDSDEMKRGARVMAVGYPLGLKSVKASMGIVSGYQQFKSALYLQITAPINPGNSGGPLFNEKGQVIGINSAKIASASGMSFSISSVQLKVMLDVLYQRRQFVVPYLGYGFSVGTKLIQQYLEVQGDHDQSGGIYITKVHPNGLFKMAGAKSGDLLLTVDGAKIDRFGQAWMPTMKDNINILGLLARKRIGSKLTLGVWRKESGSLMSLETSYDETPGFAVPFIYEPILQKPKFHIFAGIVFMELVENLIETLLEENVAELIKYMKPENRLSPAVIIAGVLPGSLADLDGSVTKGLIVDKFNGKAISKIDDICAEVASASGDWYTVSTSKTFTALKADKVEEQKDSDPEISGKTGDYCAKLLSNSTDVNANVTGGISDDGGDADSGGGDRVASWADATQLQYMVQDVQV
jgi:S1-C subfamily serine protease